MHLPIFHTLDKRPVMLTFKGNEKKIRSKIKIVSCVFYESTVIKIVEVKCGIFKKSAYLAFRVGRHECLK